MDSILGKESQLLTTQIWDEDLPLCQVCPPLHVSQSAHKAPRPWALTLADRVPFLPLLCPLGHLLLSCLAVGQAVGAAALGLPLRGELLAELLQLPLIHEPLLLECTPLLFQVLFLQDLHHILNWVWWAKGQGKVSSVVAKTGSCLCCFSKNHTLPPPGSGLSLCFCQMEPSQFPLH